MLKVRVSGTEEDRKMFSVFLQSLEKHNQLIVLNQSKHYPNRGNLSAREYFDVQIIKPEYEF